MKRPQNKWKLFWWILAGLIVINALIVVTGNSYIYKALLYAYAEIDDLKIFSTRTVHTEKPQPWPISKVYNKNPLPSELKEELQRLKTVAFLIIKDDSVRD